MGEGLFYFLLFSLMGTLNYEIWVYNMGIPSYTDGMPITFSNNDHLGRGKIDCDRVTIHDIAGS